MMHSVVQTSGQMTSWVVDIHQGTQNSIVRDRASQ